MAPGTKFLRLLGSLCARAHPEKQQETSDKEKTKFKKKNFKCIWKTRMYGVTLEIYIDIDTRVLKCERISHTN